MPYNSEINDLIITLEIHSSTSAEYMELLNNYLDSYGPQTPGKYCLEQNFQRKLERKQFKSSLIANLNAFGIDYNSSNINGIAFYRYFYEYLYNFNIDNISDCMDKKDCPKDLPWELFEHANKVYEYVETRVPLPDEYYRYRDNGYLTKAREVKNEYPIYKLQKDQPTTKSKETTMPQVSVSPILNTTKTGRIEVIRGYNVEDLTKDDAVILLGVCQEEKKALLDSPAVDTKYIADQIKQLEVPITKLITLLNK